MRKRPAQISLGTVAILDPQTRPPAGPARAAAEMEPLLNRIAAYEYGQDQEPLTLFREFVRGAGDSPQLQKQIEARLLRFLQSGATPSGKDFAFRELSLIATDQSIPVLTPMLTRAETAEMARYALARIPGRADTEALRKSLASAVGDAKIGIINTLGQRQDANSVPLLRALILSSDSVIAEAAVTALAHIGNQRALDALTAAKNKVAGPFREVVSEAQAACADRLAVGDDKAVAVKAYRQLLAPQEPRMVRIRALAGLVAVEGENAVPALIPEVESEDPGTQAAAIRLLNGIPGAGATKVLMAEFPKLSAVGQVRLLSALAERRDASARELVLAAAKNAASAVRVAALAALGNLGDSRCVLLLAEVAAVGQDLEQDAARQSLYGMRGSGIDAALVAALGSAAGRVKAELIMAAGERGTAAAADALIGAVQEQDSLIQREAIRALRNVAGSAQVPALLELLLKAPGASERKQITTTLVSVLNRSRPAPVKAVISAYQASPALQLRLSLLEVLGQTSNEAALPLLRGSLKEPSPEITRAAILALSAWDGTAPLPDLLAVARSDDNPASRILGLRGYLKLVALPSERSPAESAQLLSEAVPLASQPAEKRTVLSLLQTYPCRESLRLAETFLGDQSVAKEAKVAADQLRDSLGIK